MNKFDRVKQVIRVSDTLGITKQLAKELLILAGGDEDIVIESSLESNGLDHCKANSSERRWKKGE